MIVDHVKNAYRYAGLGPHIDIALKYLSTADLGTAEKIELDEGNIRGGAFTFMPKDPDKCNIETHRVYADIHVCLEGKEVIGYTDIHQAELNGEYDAEKDKQFYTAELNRITLYPGMFALMLENDVHAVMMRDKEPVQAKKIMMKVRL
ncbi:MAG: YhcH/YjgK/YiaL family protein [Solobacterium sp.]|nr:YhcH/YjgK/YiaL family protein [Solobacterium sp.]